MAYKAKFQVSGKITEIMERQTFNSGFTKREIVVNASANDQYEQPVKLTFKREDEAKVESLCVGDIIDAEGFVDGRRWEGAKGVQYFIELNTKSVIVTEKAAQPEVVGGDKPTKARSWEELKALGTAWGMGEEAIKGRCKDHGKAFKDMTEKDWQFIANGIIADYQNTAVEADDSMPF